MATRTEQRNRLPMSLERSPVRFRFFKPLSITSKAIACDPQVCSVYTFALSAVIILVSCFLYFDIRRVNSPGLLLSTPVFRTHTLNEESHAQKLKISPSNLAPSHVLLNATRNNDSLPSDSEREKSSVEEESAGMLKKALIRDTDEFSVTKQETTGKSGKKLPDAGEKSDPKKVEEATPPDEKQRKSRENNESAVELPSRMDFPAENTTSNSRMGGSDGDKKETVISKPGYVSRGCDISVGRWVWDESYPLYRSEACPFIDGGFRCQENGRPNDGYLKWRWQPSGCEMPRFNATNMLERLRGSRLVFVGDSIGRNQWESMICMLSEAIQNKSRIYEVNGQPITKHKGFLSFRFEDYNCTVEYYRSPFLVPQTHPPLGSPSQVRLAMKVDTMDWSSKYWHGASVLVFNAGHWWNYEKTIRGGSYFQVGNAVNTSMDIQTAFKNAIHSWAEWVDKELDTQQTTQIFFRSYAPVHFSGGTWKTGGQCHEETEPEPEGAHFGGEPWTNLVVSAEIERLKTKHVQFLNVTHLSNFRKDGHSSIYQVGKETPRPMRRQDCSHWCLPGVPDTWNEALFAALLMRGDGAWKREESS